METTELRVWHLLLTVVSFTNFNLKLRRDPRASTGWTSSEPSSPSKWISGGLSRDRDLEI